ncbi:hypothetical protein QZH41_013734, partial [Actinostola sp. cb2023]
YAYRMEKAQNLSRFINHIIKDSGYDIKSRPNDGGEPVDVTVEIKIVSFGEFLEARMEYTMDIYFRQWITLTVQCSMDFHLYPMDTQRCPLIIESYAHTIEDIKYQWKTGNKGDGIEVVSERIAQFELLDVIKDSGAQSNSKVSFLFIFCTLLEYVIVLNTDPGTKEKKKKKKTRHMNGGVSTKIDRDQEHDNTNVVITIMDRHGSSCTERHQNGKRFVAERKTRTMYSRDSSYHKVDKWSRICFPLLYALFLLGYWLYYSYVYDAL